MTTYSLPELLKMMKPRQGRDQALIRKCITGLGLYAAQQARADPTIPKIAELRGLIENLASAVCRTSRSGLREVSHP